MTPKEQFPEKLEKQIHDIASRRAESKAKSHLPDPLRSPNLFTKQLEIEEEEKVREFLSHFLKGKQELLNALGASSEDVQKIIDELRGIDDPLAGYEERNRLELPDAAMEKFNQIVAALYESGDYQKAIEVYSFLSFLEPTEPAYWLGLGHSNFYAKQYESAIHAYSSCLEIDPENPHCHLYMAHCYHALDLDSEAIAHVDTALELINKDKQFTALQEPAKDLKTELTISKINQ